MAKGIEDINRALKLKAQSKPGSLSIKVGTKKYTLPFEVRTLQSDKFLFVHIPPAASTLKITAEGVEIVESSEEAVAAQQSFRQPRKRGGAGKRGSAKVELPDELKDALRKIPAGFKLVMDASGSPRLVRTRKRRS